MDRPEKFENYIRILVQIAGALFVPPDDPEILPMGEEYRLAMTRLQMKRNEMFCRIRGDLSELSPDQLKQGLGDNSTPLSEEAKKLIRKYRTEVEEKFGRLKVWYSAPLFRTNQLADFEHWSKSEFLSLDETVWLSVGLEPDDQFIAAVKKYDHRGSKQELDEVATFMSRHREILRRKFDPYDQGKNPRFNDVLEWIGKVNLEVHPKFVELVEGRAGQSKEASEGDAASRATTEMDGRERASMSKLIAAMAIDAYGFDPSAKRSDIPTEIQGIADRLGLELTTKTIRKYLRDGAQMLPEDWKPE